ncbi:sensor domain-containing diguanylate cyclase [Peptococcaceae bacterium 1198_IL3148]
MIDNYILQLTNKLSLSYELALSIGQSLHLEEMLQEFIDTLARKTSALRGIVWTTQQDMVSFGAGAGYGVRDIDQEQTAAAIKLFLPDLINKGVMVINQDDYSFSSCCYPQTGREKEVLLILINNSLVIHLIYGRTKVTEEGIADIIRTLKTKIHNAVSACLNYKKLLAYERKEKNRLESELVQSEERYRLLTESALAGVFLIQNKVLRYANPKFAEIFGYQPDELLGNFKFDSLASADDKARISQWQENVINARSADNNQLVFSARKKDGDMVVCECMGAKTLYNDESAIVGTLIDITDRMRLESELKYLATHDSLTRLYNRTYLEELLANYKGNNDVFPITIIMCDLDHFKNINDSYGHLKGDVVLKEVAQLLKTSLRKDDILARYGGDEFIVLLPNTSNLLASQIVQRIENAIANCNQLENKLPISMSLGFATANDCSQLEEAINKADSNMYVSKAAKC